MLSVINRASRTAAPIWGRMYATGYALPVTKMSKTKKRAKRLKLENKRLAKKVKAQEQQERRKSSVDLYDERVLESKLKLEEAQEITKDLSPLSDELLEAMYQGLISAPPEEFTTAAIDRMEAELLAIEDVNFKALSGAVAAIGARLLGDSSNSEASATVPAAEAGQASSDFQSLVKDPSSVDNSFFESGEVLETPPQSLAKSNFSTLVADLAGYVSEHKGDLSLSFGECTDLLLAGTLKKDSQLVSDMLDIFDKDHNEAIQDDSILKKMMAIYSKQHRPHEALALAKKATELGWPISTVTQHYLITSLAQDKTTINTAIAYLYAIEDKGYVPLQVSYAAITRALLHTPQWPTYMVQRGWDLFAHMRFKSHPVPSVEMFSVMIKACSIGAHVAPERAIDLFKELTDDNHLPPSVEAYTGLIRACARSRQQNYYFESLRYLKRMMVENLVPTTETFNAVLEGCKHFGDLARARWILFKMISLRGVSEPDVNSFALVLQTYASFKPQVTQHNQKFIVVSSDQNIRTVPAQEEKQVSSFQQQPEHASDSATSEVVATSDVGSETDLEFPGALPVSVDELLAEAKHFMKLCVGGRIFDEEDADTAEIFHTKPSPFLLNSYLQVLVAKAPFDDSVHFFNTAFRRAKVNKYMHTYEIMMHRCEVAKNRDKALSVAQDIFKEWQKWSKTDGLGPKAEEQHTYEGSDNLEPKEFIEGKHISEIWASLIRILSRSFMEDEALSILQKFIQTYPPNNLISHATVLRFRSQNLPKQTSPAKMAAIQYPETQSRKKSELPPYILFNDIKILHLRLTNMEDKRGLDKMKGITSAYTHALETAQDILMGRKLSDLGSDRDQIRSLVIDRWELLQKLEAPKKQNLI